MSLQREQEPKKRVSPKRQRYYNIEYTNVPVININCATSVQILCFTVLPQYVPQYKKFGEGYY